ncbi:HAD family hydrolase [Bifidobacterium aemilianum]|uniref:HAD family hydrolase n=1 Tax=Bifidobacterium aemilianum TaxID=2493120 RepID=A0A366KB73_9BIFI|nr:HAD family phosphatase [Bifidobacterium aemilianum]RBP98428.1 HAD family hydrolase [Bifidobacterium aemilianum]
MTGWPGEPRMEYDKLIAQGQAAGAAGKPIEHVIFDFGNVLVYWDARQALLSRYDQASIERFLDNDVSGFYDAADMMDANTGQEEAIDWMRRTHGGQWADMLAYYLDNFEDSLTGLVPGARVLIEDLKAAGIGVWGLSNWERELFIQAEGLYPILGQLQDRVVSGFVNLRKPDPAIYRMALDSFGLDPSTSIFVDDKAMNIVAANQVGLRGVRFSDHRKLRQILIASGIDIPNLRSVR